MDIKLITMNTEVPIVQLPKTDRKSQQLWVPVVSIDFILNGIEYHIKPGFVTNLGSVPKIFRNLVDKADETTLAYIIHDYLYSKDAEGVTRKDADKTLYKVALMCKQTKFEAGLAWIGVRIGGWLKFKKNSASYTEVPKELINKICVDNNYKPTVKDLQQVNQPK